jgi:methionyl-tRNA synthetase
MAKKKKQAKLIDGMIDELQLSLKQIMETNGSNIEDQRQTLKIMFVEFSITSKNENLQLVQDVVVDFVRKEYPHLNKDLDKLLILS